MQHSFLNDAKYCIDCVEMAWKISLFISNSWCTADKKLICGNISIGIHKYSFSYVSVSAIVKILNYCGQNS